MNRFILISLVLLSNYAFGQSRLPDSYINVSIGSGAGYGSLGTKTVIGRKNSGLMIGLGRSSSGYVQYQIGGQLSYKWMYAILSYGTTGSNEYPSRPREITKGGNVSVGSMIGLGKSRRTFIDLGMGYYLNPSSSEDRYAKGIYALSYVVGVGYRIGNRNK